MTTYTVVTCVECGKDRTIVRNNKPLPQRCDTCARRLRARTPNKNRSTPTNKISDEKARLRDTFLEQFRDTKAPCKQAPDVWMSERLADRNRAKKTCREKCNLVDACYAWALAPPRETYGVFGGRDWGPKEDPDGHCRTCPEPIPEGSEARYCPACRAKARARQNRSRAKKNRRQAQ